MHRANYPDSMHDMRSVIAGAALAIVDFIILAIMFLWVVVICNGGVLTGSFDVETKLFFFHLAHLAVMIPALFLLALAALFMPIWFIIIGLVVFFIDIFVLVSRFNIIANGIFNPFCTVFLLLFDVILLITAGLYIAFGISALTRYTLFGDQQAIHSPYGVPLPTGTSTIATTTATFADKNNAIPSVYVDTNENTNPSNVY